MKRKENHNGHDKITVVTLLNRKQVDHLDKIGKDSFFKFGHKISRGKILAELVDLLMHLKIDYKNIDLEQRDLHEVIERLLNNEGTART